VATEAKAPSRATAARELQKPQGHNFLRFAAKPRSIESECHPVRARIGDVRFITKSGHSHAKAQASLSLAWPPYMRLALGSSSIEANRDVATYRRHPSAPTLAKTRL